MGKKVIYAYTDGSSVVKGKNKGNGGFGTYFPDLFGKPKAFSLGFKQAKTGKMEVMALLYALKAMPDTYSETVKLIVYSDSEYVVKSFTEKRLKKWIAAGWRNSSGKVKNKKLWEKINLELISRGYLELEMRHIKSHQVEKEKDPEKRKILRENQHIKGNLIADFLADYKRHKVLY